MKKGWLVNDFLTCIPGTKTFWHDLLEWLPGLEAQCFPYPVLAEIIESLPSRPDYIIRNASYFRPINFPAKTISLIQDIGEQWDVINSSDTIVFNSPYTASFYEGKINRDSKIIPLGVDFNHFKPCKFDEQIGILPNSILFVGSSQSNPKGFDKVLELLYNSNYNFCFVMKDDYELTHPRVKIFNKVCQDKMKQIYNSCSMLVCTSIIETQHLAGLEAAACGLPLVATNVGAYFGLTDGDWGVKVRDDNFLEAIDRVMNNLSGFSSRNFFLKAGYDKESCRKSWIKLIEEKV
jgi:glycosyltransferase involved in cell wall biosynthesis